MMKIGTIFRSWKIPIISFLGMMIIQLPSALAADDYSAEQILLELALHKISQKYDVHFNYDRNIMNDVMVEYEEDNAFSLAEALDHVFENTHFGYRIFEQRYIVVFENNDEGTESLKNMITHMQDLVEERESVKKRGVQPVIRLSTLSTKDLYNKRFVFGVSGFVVDEEGEPLIGVNIQVKGSNKGTSTDFDGSFTLEDIDENAVLVVSYVGYQTQEVQVAGKSNLEIIMTSDSQLLDEVVVVGYGTQKKSDLTGSVVRADIESFREMSNSNILQSLQGVIPGLTIGQTDQAGGEPSIQIRGENTISGNTSPLIVVDGIIFNGRIGDLNPHDIQSVDILKDSSSKAIYGAQAANGVILITTKAGKHSEKTSITFSSRLGVQTPTTNTRFLNASEMKEFVRDANYMNSYLPPDYTEQNPDWDFSQAMLRDRQYQGFINGTDWDWWSTLIQTGMMNDNILSINGGTEKTRFYLSGGYNIQKGVQKNDNYKRTSLRISLGTDISKWLQLGTNTFGSFSDVSGVFPSVGLQSTSPFNSPYDEDGNLEYALYGVEINPLLVYQIDDNNVRNRINSTFYSIVKIPQIDGLEYRINFGNDYSWTDHFNGNKWGEGNVGSVYKNYSSQMNRTIDNILSYDNRVGNHRISSTLLYGYRKNESNSTSANGVNVSNIALSYNKLQQAITQSISSSGWNETFMYQMGRINYSYSDTYMLTATLRRDGYSGFSPNRKFGFFPSASLAWIISNEPFLNVPSLDYMKIRGSYGVNGNLTGRYTSLAQVSSNDSNAYVFGDGTETSKGQSPSSMANDDLSWEKTAGFNFGLDFVVFNNLIGGNIDYYNTFTTDLLWDMTLPLMTGFSSIRTNLGKIQNTGFEFALNVNPIEKKNIHWNLNLNFYTNNNRIVALTGEIDDNGKEIDLVASNLFIGKSLGAIYDYQIDGIWQINDEIPNGYFPGNYRIIDQNGDGEITADDDRVFLGRKEPLFSFGIDNTVNIKNLSLHVFINSIQGGKNSYLKNIGTMSSTGLDNINNSGYFKFFDGWTRSNPDAKYAVNYQSPAIRPNNYQSRSFVRLQDVSLAYQVRNSFLERNGIGNLKIFISGKNLWTLTNWDAWDPETGRGFSTSLVTFPVLKTYSFGIDVSL